MHLTRRFAPCGSRLVWTLAVVGALAVSSQVLAKVYDIHPPTAIDGVASLLRPGDTLVVHAGTYPHAWIEALNGTASAWITIKGADGEARPVVTTDASRNVIDLYNVSYLKLQNLEITGGSDAVKFQTNTTSHDVVLENLYCHNLGSTGINAAGVTELYNLTVRGCEISFTGGNGEGMYFGAQGAYTQLQVHDSLVERNFVHNVIGDGIELKHGDHHVTIQDNVVNATGGWPGITVWGTYKNDPSSNNIVRRNLVYTCTDCDIQALGETNVESNICVNSLGSGIYTRGRDGDGKLQYLRIVNNTVYKAATDALAIRDGNVALGLVVANNAIIQNSASASAFAVYQGLSAGTIVSANVTYGVVSGVATGVTAAISPSAVFTNASTTLGQMDLYPKAGSILIDSGNNTQAASADFNLVNRPQGSAADVGAYEVTGATNPAWPLAAGLKVVGVIGDFNHDGSVDVVDLLFFVDSFGKVIGDTGFNADCDINADGSVDVVDLLTFLEHWPQ